MKIARLSAFQSGRSTILDKGWGAGSFRIKLFQKPYRAGKVNTWVIFSLFALGFKGASVRRTGCSSGATRSSL